MMTDDDFMGRKRADLDEIKEIKVKLPVRQLLLLHYAKLVTSRSISEVVGLALVTYFEGLKHEAHPEPTITASI